MVGEEQEADAKMKEQEAARAKAEAERREQEQRIQVIRQQYYSGYVKLGSFYITKTLTTSKSWGDVKSMPQRCQIGGWSDWRFPTESEADWIRYCFDGGNMTYDDIVGFFMHNEWGQYADYVQKCMWQKNGSINQTVYCNGTVYY